MMVKTKTLIIATVILTALLIVLGAFLITSQVEVTMEPLFQSARPKQSIESTLLLSKRAIALMSTKVRSLSSLVLSPGV